MHDENAFGLWIAYFDIEDDEYAGVDQAFVERFTLFERLVLERLSREPLATSPVVMRLGHGVYVEWSEGEHCQSPIAWAKALRVELAESDFRTACALTHGGRWVLGEAPSVQAIADVEVRHVSLPSEPLRRALYLDAATHGAPDEDSAWGPGLYVDTEAVDALALTPKNRPTSLEVAGAEFFRLGR